MSEKTLKFNNIKINKKEFHNSKQVIDLDSVDTDKIVVSFIQANIHLRASKKSNMKHLE